MNGIGLFREWIDLKCDTVHIIVSLIKLIALYKQYFHFKETPFSIAPDPHFLYMSGRHQEGLAHLLYGINAGGGFIALTGEVGTGKTTLCQCLLQQLPEDVDIALILNPKLNALELLANICDELGIAYEPDRQSLKVFTDLLNKYLLAAHAKGRRTVLMIDEAQNLSFEVLEQIRLLTNLETAKTKLLQIVLVGQPELKQLLNRKELRQLNQRITARYHLEALSLAETRTYIQHRLSVSGGDTDIFRDSAARRIYQISHGIPRLINILCDRALLGAYAIGVRHITPGIVNKAAKEALDTERKLFSQVQLFVILFCLIGFGLAASYYFSVVEQSPPLQPAHRTEPAPANQPAPVAPRGETAAVAAAAPPPPPATDARSAEDRPAPTRQTASDFGALLDNPELSLQRALLQAFAMWGEKLPENRIVNCQIALQNGYRCLLDQGDLKELLGLDRPAILEFVLKDKQKRYALLIGMHRGYPILRTADDAPVKLEELLTYWQGYYLILWKPPFPAGTITLYPDQSSERVLWLREQLAHIDGGKTTAAQPNFFDRQLERRVKAFQRSNHLNPDGIVGPRTIIYLQNAYSTTDFPKLEHTD